MTTLYLTGPTGELVITVWCSLHARGVITADEYPNLIPLPVALALARGDASASLDKWDGGWVVDLMGDGLYCQALTTDEDAATCRMHWTTRAEAR